mgnify:CR=1
MAQNQTLTNFTVEAESTTAGTETVDVPDRNGSDEYGTPRWLIQLIQDHVNIDLDPCSGAEPEPFADLRFTKEDDSLTKRWARPGINTIVLNPPYANPKPFLRRLTEAVDPSDPEKANLGISITRGDTSTEWFHKYLTEAKCLFFRDDRYSFIGGSGDSGFSCTIAIFGEPPQSLLQDLASEGEFYTQVEVDTALEQQCLDDLLADGGAAAALPVTTPSTNSGTPTPGDGHSLDFVGPHDELTIKLSENRLVGSGLPDEIDVQVLPDGKSLTTETGEIEIDAIGVADDGTQVCARIRNNPATLTSVEVTIAVGMDHWEVVTPKEIIQH